MINPFKFLKRDGQVDPVQLEKAIDQLYELSDDSKIQKPSYTLQDSKRRVEAIRMPSGLKISSSLDEKVGSAIVTFSWVKPEGAYRHELEVGIQLQNDYHSGVKEVYGISHVETGYAPGTVIKARVRAITDTNIASEWTSYLEHTVTTGLKKAADVSDIEVKKFGRWVLCRCGRIKLKDLVYLQGFEWHADKAEDFTPDRSEDRENMLVNPSFEYYDSGNEVTGWSINGTLGSDTYSTTYHRKGSASLKANIDTAGDYVYQTVTLQPGTSYEISGFAKAAGAVNNVQIELNFTSGGVASGYDSSQTKNISTVWTKFSWIFKTDATATQTCRVRLRISSTGTGTVYWDEMCLRQTSGTFKKFTRGNFCLFQDIDDNTVYVKVRSLDANGNYSSFSDSVASELAFATPDVDTEAPYWAVSPNLTQEATYKTLSYFFTRWVNHWVSWTAATDDDTGIGSGLGGYYILRYRPSTSSDDEDWDYVWLSADGVKTAGGICYGCVPRLQENKDYTVQIAAADKWGNQSAWSAGAGYQITLTTTEPDAPVATNITPVVLTDSDHKGISTGVFFTTAYQGIGFPSSEISSEDVVFLYVKYGIISGGPYLNHRFIILNNLDKATVSGTEYYILRLDSLLPSKDASHLVTYYLEVRYVNYALKLSAAWDTLSFAAAYPTVGSITVNHAYVYPTISMFPKLLPCWLHIDWTVSGGSVRSYEVRIARLKWNETTWASGHYWMVTVPIFNPADSGAVEEATLPLLPPRFDTYGSACGFRFNIRPWLNFQHGSPLSGSDWDEPESGNWYEPTLETISNETVPTPSAPDVDWFAWRFVTIKFDPNNDYDYPVHFKRFHLHVSFTHDFTPDTTNYSDEVVVGPGSFIKDKNIPCIGFIPFLVKSGSIKKICTLDDIKGNKLHFKTSVEVWSIASNKTISVDASKNSAQSSLINPSGVNTGEDKAWFDSWNSAQGRTPGYTTNDWIPTPAVVITEPLTNSETSIDVINGVAGYPLLAADDLVIMGKAGRPIFTETAEVMRITSITAGADGAGGFDTLNVTRGWKGSSPEASSSVLWGGDILIKVGRYNTTYSFMYWDSATFGMKTATTDDSVSWDCLKTGGSTPFIKDKTSYGSPTGSGDIELAAGADIYLTSSSTNPATIFFGSDAFIQCNTSTDWLMIDPYVNSTGQLSLGSPSYRWDFVQIVSDNKIQLYVDTGTVPTVTDGNIHIQTCLGNIHLAASSSEALKGGIYITAYRELGLNCTNGNLSFNDAYNAEITLTELKALVGSATYYIAQTGDELDCYVSCTDAYGIDVYTDNTDEDVYITAKYGEIYFENDAGSTDLSTIMAASSSSTISYDTNCLVSCSTSGVNITAINSGDGIYMDLVGDPYLNITTTSTVISRSTYVYAELDSDSVKLSATANNYLAVSTSGISLVAADSGDDIDLTAVNGAIALVSESGSVTLSDSAAYLEFSDLSWVHCIDGQTQIYTAEDIPSYDLYEIDCSSLTSWGDMDSGTGVSSQTTYDNKSCFKFFTTASADAASRSGPSTYTITSSTYYIGFSVQPKQMTGNSYFLFQFESSGHLIYCKIDSGGIYIQNDSGVFIQAGSTQPITVDNWSVVTLYVDESTDTCDVYVNGTVLDTDMEIDADAGAIDGYLIVSLYAGTVTSDVNWYLNYIHFGTTLTTEVGSYVAVNFDNISFNIYGVGGLLLTKPSANNIDLSFTTGTFRLLCDAIYLKSYTTDYPQISLDYGGGSSSVFIFADASNYFTLYDVDSGGGEINLVSTGSVKVPGQYGLVLGSNLATNVAGFLQLWSAGANNYYTTFTAATQTENCTYTLPVAMPDVTGYVLSCTDAGVMSWAAASGGGDASAITFTPATLSNWNSGVDPGNTDDALDQLAANLNPMLPPSAPILDYISYTSSAGTAGKNTWNAANPISTYNNAPTDSVVNSGDALDITMVTSGTGKGVYDYDSFTYVTGVLNDDVTAHAYSYPADSFSPGGSDGGATNDLKLVVNGSVKHTTDLLTFSSGNSVNGNSSGFYSLSAATSVKFADASDFTPRKYRTGSWRVYLADLSRGHNTIKTQHTTASGTTTCTVWEFLLDDDDTATSYSSESISGYSPDASLKYLSGVKFTTGTRTATYNITFSNAYRNTYSVSSSAVNYTGTNCTISDEALAVSGGDEAKSVAETQTLTLSASPARLVGSTVSVSTTIDRTVQSEAASSGASLAQVLWDNVSASSTALIEYFDDEDYRIQCDEDFNTNLSATWSETDSLVGADGGYNIGLQCVSSILDYPTVNYSTYTNGPSSNVNYSSASGTRYYFRYFTNATGASNFRITTSSSAANSFNWISKDDTLGTSNDNIRIALRWPTQTGWLDTKTAFIEGQFGSTSETATAACSAGCYSSSLGSDFTDPPCSVGITCGTKTTSNSYNKVYMRIEVGQGWTGSIDDITLVWGAT